MIEGVVIKELKVIPDEKGEVRHMMRSDDPFFRQFGEVYFSFINPGHVKAWKKHFRQVQHLAVPVGEIGLVIYDEREGSPTKGRVEEYFLGEKQYRLIRIPSGVWYGFTALNNQRALVVNCVDIPHHPEESIKRDPYDQFIPYQWK